MPAKGSRPKTALRRYADRACLEKPVLNQKSRQLGIPELPLLPNALSGFAETYEVSPDNAALAAGLTVSNLADTIESSNRNDGAGCLVLGEEALIVRATGTIRDLQDLASIVVRSDSGTVLRVGDLAVNVTGKTFLSTMDEDSLIVQRSK